MFRPTTSFVRSLVELFVADGLITGENIRDEGQDSGLAGPGFTFEKKNIVNV